MEKIPSRPIHPFAARMAPEIAFEALGGLSKKSIILDPMAGSGTVLRTISELGYSGIGIDVDPLAILMSKVWTTKVNKSTFLKKSDLLLLNAKKLKLSDSRLPWIDKDYETKKFIEFWFAPNQIRSLKKLCYLINSYEGIYSSIFKVALSRLIITKSRGASLASDVSHSRPHKTRHNNDFEVFDEFQSSCNKLMKFISSEKLLGNIKIKRGDARNLTCIENKSIDSIITSPPYLNALDYMRGHKLSLVWLGYRVSELSEIKSSSVGVERAPMIHANIEHARRLVRVIYRFKQLPARTQNIIYRYALDIDGIFSESARVLKKNRNATFVIGNSSLHGIYIKNTRLAEEAAFHHGFRLVDSKEREIPHNRRYLPPPTEADNSSFKTRMKTESILTFLKK